jgi:SAM-dependent methyltransferase
MSGRLFRVHVAFSLLGLGVAAVWVALTGHRPLLAGLAQARWPHVALLLAITASWHVVRFVRWQYLLRRVGVRLPIHPSLSIYAAGIPGTATPAYIGELIRGVIIRRRFAIPLGVTTPVLVVERLLDVSALALLLGAATGLVAGWGIPLLILAGTWMIGLACGTVARWWGVSGTVLSGLQDIKVLAPALGLTLLAWLPVCFSVSIAADALGMTVPLGSGARIFSAATLYGGLTLMPAGVGVTGSAVILQLQNLGLGLGTSVVVASLVRLMTTGVSLALGSVVLLHQMRGLRRVSRRRAADHFQEIAADYGDQLSPHVWSHLLQRKVGMMAEALEKVSASVPVGLDLGCGLGRHCREVARRGARIVGLDAAHGLLRQARAAGVDVAMGDALQLPFADETFDLVFTIGVLHHLEGPGAQEAAVGEVARVLKQSGVFVVHETNPRNPLFRFYMGYVFPLLKRIDEGTEWWIEPARWEHVPGLELEGVRYFSFLPDFTPRWLMPAAQAVERLLEKSVLHRYSVHYMAVLKRRSDA